MENSIKRIEPRDAWEKITSGSAELVCAYDDPEKWRQNRLKYAVDYNQFRFRSTEVPLSREIIFYCA